MHKVFSLAIAILLTGCATPVTTPVSAPQQAPTQTTPATSQPVKTGSAEVGVTIKESPPVVVHNTATEPVYILDTAHFFNKKISDKYTAQVTVTARGKDAIAQFDTITKELASQGYTAGGNSNAQYFWELVWNGDIKTVDTTANNKETLGGYLFSIDAPSLGEDRVVQYLGMYSLGEKPLKEIISEEELEIHRSIGGYRQPKTVDNGPIKVTSLSLRPALGTPNLQYNSQMDIYVEFNKPADNVQLVVTDPSGKMVTNYLYQNVVADDPKQTSFALGSAGLTTATDYTFNIRAVDRVTTAPINFSGTFRTGLNAVESKKAGMASVINVVNMGDGDTRPQVKVKLDGFATNVAIKWDWAYPNDQQPVIIRLEKSDVEGWWELPSWAQQKLESSRTYNMTVVADDQDIFNEVYFTK